jgi:hypothetical protein
MTKACIKEKRRIMNLDKAKLKLMAISPTNSVKLDGMKEDI